ncbi:hypothetical protein CAEBREN_24667 [Caenorhabditis brenneri]|uniref:Uncharacterized protein n=1 Tax=Caenorhabditis brenneri TaxID=135651 RepID=G0NEE8_CAEBE|nr:hypothetical protein CAEBREN_24667 [Caenorhabditis brenneri]
MASLKFLAIFAILVICCAMLGAAQDGDMDAVGVREKRQWGYGRGGWGGGWGRPYGGYGGWGGRGYGGWGGRGMGGWGWGR